MGNFTTVYKKAREVATSQKFAANWEKILTDEIQLTSLLGNTGLGDGHGDKPEKLRIKISSEVKASGGKKKAADVILEAATNAGGGVKAERAATLKMVKHLHETLKKGGQTVWVYSPPKGYIKWMFEEITGTDANIKARLAKEEEIFTSKERNWMSEALSVSLKICEDTKVKLGAADKNTKKMVKDWFLDEDCGDNELKDAMAKLTAGFNKIAVVCQKNSLVFADYIDWRSKRNKYYGGAIPGGEGGGFPVIYLEGAFTRMTGNSGKVWLCAETIIHEFSHHEISTKDHRYDSSGLKPNKGSFPYSKTIENADSWGYFAIDLAGYLSATDRAKTLK